jgi:hypothetical protein
MEKKYQIIYIWSFIIISGVILLLLYTPLGGDIHYAAYREQNRYAVSPGVNYERQIGAMSGVNAGGNGSYGYSAAPSPYNSETFRAISAGGISTSSSINAGQGGVSGGITTLSSRTKTSGGGSGSGGGIGISGVGGRKSTEVSNTFASGGGIGGSLVNTTGTNTGGVMQRGTNDEGDPLDPGGDPGGNPLPIGNEMGILTLMAGLFAIYKWLKK